MARSENSSQLARTPALAATRPPGRRLRHWTNTASGRCSTCPLRTARCHRNNTANSAPQFLVIRNPGRRRSPRLLNSDLPHALSRQAGIGARWSPALALAGTRRSRALRREWFQHRSRRLPTRYRQARCQSTRHQGQRSRPTRMRQRVPPEPAAAAQFQWLMRHAPHRHPAGTQHSYADRPACSCPIRKDLPQGPVPHQRPHSSWQRRPERYCHAPPLRPACRRWARIGTRPGWALNRRSPSKRPQQARRTGQRTKSKLAEDTPW
jgi:hypothetical protein